MSRRSGIVTETDLIRKVLAKGIDPSLALANQIMTSPLLTITPDRPMLDASHLMETNQSAISVSRTRRKSSGSFRSEISCAISSIQKGAPSVTSTTYTGPSACSCDTTMETIASERTVLEAAQTMAEKRIGSLLVIEAGEMVGIVTETDVVRKVIAARLPASSTRVGAVMNYPLIQIDINHTVRDASRLMAEERIRHLAVTEDNEVVGLLSVRDLVKMVSVRDKPRFLRNT